MTAMCRLQGEKWWWIVREEKGIGGRHVSQIISACCLRNGCLLEPLRDIRGLSLCGAGGGVTYEFTQTYRDTHLGGCVSEASQFCKYTGCACFHFYFGMQDSTMFSPDDLSVLKDGDVSGWMFSAGFGFTKWRATTRTGSCLCLYLRTDVWRQFALCVNWQFDGGSWWVSQRWCYCMTYCRQAQTTVGSALRT